MNVFVWAYALIEMGTRQIGPRLKKKKIPLSYTYYMTLLLFF